jgi:hypothetical protein
VQLPVVCRIWWGSIDHHRRANDEAIEADRGLDAESRGGLGNGTDLKETLGILLTSR